MSHPDPTIYQVVELPEDEKGEPCPLWPEADGACGSPVEFVFVHEASLDSDDDTRRNCLCCPQCKPVEGVGADDGRDVIEAGGGGCGE